jgi:hypothetical protein
MLSADMARLQRVAIDGDTVVAGVVSNTEEVGLACVFERNAGGANAWGRVAVLSGGRLQYASTSVAISADTIVMGSVEPEIAGQVYQAASVFERNRGGANRWGFRSRMVTAPPIPPGQLAAAPDVAIDGATIVVGGLGAHVFERDRPVANAWGEVFRSSYALTPVGPSRSEGTS